MKRYSVYLYYGGEYPDTVKYTDSLHQAKQWTLGAEHSEIEDNIEENEN